ncbi:TPA: hypothetical protein ACU21S_001991 [Mannheimia haemolytica]
MANFIRKTFGGLSLSYYLRHFLFGLLIFALFIFAGVKHPKTGEWNIPVLTILIISQFLYPYARFVYESIIDYIFGNNVFFANAILVLIVKLFTMILCYIFAIFIAPIGLIYLYFYHTKQEKLHNS